MPLSSPSNITIDRLTLQLIRELTAGLANGGVRRVVESSRPGEFLLLLSPASHMDSSTLMQTQRKLLAGRGESSNRRRSTMPDR